MNLHGHPIKIGDKVWDVIRGEGIVREQGRGDTPPLPSAIDVGFDDFHILYTFEGYERDTVPPPGYAPRLYWQPIADTALAAARTPPPEPVYEYQWIVQRPDGDCYLTPHARGMLGIGPHTELGDKVLGKLEVSKRPYVEPEPAPEWNVRATERGYSVLHSRAGDLGFSCDFSRDATELAKHLNATRYQP